jgi:hypothetical protein
MTYPVADEAQEIDLALRAAAHSRWVELREQRNPREAERHDWIRALLIGEELRSRLDDVLRIDRIAHTLAPDEVKRWATEHKFFEGLDRLKKDLDDIARTDFRHIAGGRCDRP